MKIKNPGEYKSLDLRPPKLKNWRLVRDEKNLVLLYKNEIKHTFKGHQSNKCKIFALMFENTGILIPYKNIYEFYSIDDYPKYKRAGIHKEIQRTLNHLKKDLENLPLKIVTDKGACLYISDHYDESIKLSDKLVALDDD